MAKGETKETKLPRAYSMKDLNKIVYQVFLFTGVWLKLFGKPEKGATWFIWGLSGNGKSTACAKLAYMLSGFGTVLYLALEEKKGKSIRMKLNEEGFNDNSKNFRLLPFSSFQQLVQRLHRRNSEDIIFIDSLQYWGITYRQYQTLLETFPTKTFVVVSHAKGKDPKGGVAESIHYDAAVKIWVEGGKIIVKHRFEGGGGEMIVIPELSEKYWCENGSRNDAETVRILMRFIIDNKLLQFLRPYVEKMGYSMAQLNLKMEV